MNAFWTYVINWFKQIIVWVYSNILSIRIGNVTVAGWMLGIVIVGFTFSFILRLRGDRWFGYRSSRGAKASVDSAVASGSTTPISANGKGRSSSYSSYSGTSGNPGRVSLGRYHNAHRGKNEGW